MKTTKTAKTTATTTKPSSLDKARAMAKAITTDAKAKAATQPKGTAAKANGKAKAQPATARFDYTQRVQVNPKGATHKGFFGVVAHLAKKPISLNDLISKVQKEVKFTSTKSPEYVTRVRVRHALSRLGVLVAAK